MPPRALPALALFLVLLGAGAAQALEPVVQTRPDGSELERYDVDEQGRKHGNYVQLHANGQVAVRAAYREDQRHGAYKAYDEAGHLREHKIYRKGVLHGPFKAYHENGRLKITAAYRDGMLDGPYHLRDDDGTTRMKAKYKDGLRDGTLRVWDGTKLVSDQTWKLGEPLDVDGVRPFSRSVETLTKELARLLEGDGHLAEDPLEADRELALRYLKAYRCISGVPYDDVTVNPSFQAYAQAAAEVCHDLGHITHFPENPGWETKRFDFAAIGTRSSNLAQGRIACRSVRAYMDDSDERNIAKVGHRAWCMNPAMTQTGFGTVDRFSAMWSISGDRKQVPEYDFVACPPPGHAPAGWFGPQWAWSISLNPKRYDAPQAGSVGVEVVPVDETFLPTGPALAQDHLSVLNASAGIPYMVVFRPVGPALETGARYRVTVQGLTAKGKARGLRYYVSFFDAAYPDPLTAAPTDAQSVLGR